MPFRILSLFAAVILFAAFTNAQIAAVSPSPSPTPDAEAEKKKAEKIIPLVDQMLTDVQNLRLASNRAVILGMAGDLYWKYDQGRARELFQAAANEMQAAQAEEEKDRNQISDSGYYYFDDFDIRFQIVPMIAKWDAELALEILVRTRPAKVAAAIAKLQQPSTGPQRAGGFDMEAMRGRREIQLEQSLAAIVAEQDPEKAVKMIKESLSKGISYSLINLLQKLHQKDEKKAAELGAVIISKILDTDLTRREEEMGVAVQMLVGNSTRQPAAPDTKTKQFRFTDAQMRSLANKLADTFANAQNAVWVSRHLTRALPEIEKIAPERAAQLRLKRTDMMKSIPPEFAQNVISEKMFDPNTSPEDLLDILLKNSSDINRSPGYQTLIRRIAAMTDETRAKGLIDRIPDEDIRNRAQNAYDSARSGRLAAAGDLEGARRQISSITNRSVRIERLVALAKAFRALATEDSNNAALDIMAEARSLTGDFPENSSQMRDILAVIDGYSSVDADAAFKMLDPVMIRLDEVLAASALLSRFAPSIRGFRNGEMVLSPDGSRIDGSSPLARFMQYLPQLGSADLDRTLLAAERLQRPDARLMIKIAALRGFNGTPTPSAGAGFGTTSVVNVVR